MKLEYIDYVKLKCIMTKIHWKLFSYFNPSSRILLICPIGGSIMSRLANDAHGIPWYYDAGHTFLLLSVSTWLEVAHLCASQFLSLFKIDAYSRLNNATIFI